MTKKKLIIIALISLLSLVSCSKKDMFFSFCTSSDYKPEYYHSYSYASEGDVIFGQYYGLGGFIHGCSCGMNKNYQGLPDGEVIAFWKSFKYDSDKEYEGKYKKFKNVEQETFYYAYDPDMKIKVPPKNKKHRKYTTFLSFGRFKLRPEALKGMDLTNIPYAKTSSKIKFYQAGEIDKFYALILSETDDDDKLIDIDGFFMTPPSEFYEIQAIEITEEQHDYFYRNIANADNVHLNEQVPGFTEKQKKYMDARKRKD